MTKKKRLQRNLLLRALFTITVGFSLAPSPLQAAATDEQGNPAAAVSTWLPENDGSNPASSPGAKMMLSKENFYVAQGKASYYANNFNGKKTANGETCRLNHFTAAHRTLPFGTSVRVINLDNGKNVVVRINDRGPHQRNRIIDISHAAAKEIGLVRSGTANVRIEACN
jgi:rare lipoprotein A